MKFSSSTQTEIDKLYKGRRHVELTIGIRRDGEQEILHLGPDRKEKAGEELVYPVGSICKPFTASLLAKYLAEGKLDLHAPINQYIQGLPDRYYPNLEKLATHTSGFKTQPYTLWTTIPFFLKMNQEGGLFHTNPFRGYPDETGMMKILRETKLEDKPYPFVYSNIGMGILGYIVGQVSGEGFWDSMNRYIKEDLQLEHTFLGNVDLPGYDKKDQPCRCWQWEKSDGFRPASVWLLSAGRAASLPGYLPRDSRSLRKERQKRSGLEAGEGCAHQLAHRRRRRLQRLPGRGQRKENHSGCGSQLWPCQRGTDWIQHSEKLRKVIIDIHCHKSLTFMRYVKISMTSFTKSPSC